MNAIIALAGILPAALPAAFSYTIAQTAIMREEPNDASKVASETFATEEVVVEKQQGEWSYIKTPDSYHGWVRSSSIITRPDRYETSLKVTTSSAYVFDHDDTEWGPIATLEYGARLKALDTSAPRWFKVQLPDNRVCFIQKGNVLPEAVCHEPKDLVPLSMKFLGVLYKFGGRSGLGFDCSGFCQMLYGHLGVSLERDARQQIHDSRFSSVTVENVQPGDLVFFGKSSDHITHMGMCIGWGRFIHATPAETQHWIHMSNLSDAPWNGETLVLPYRLFRHYNGTE